MWWSSHIGPELPPRTPAAPMAEGYPRNPGRAVRHAACAPVIYVALAPKASKAPRVARDERRPGEDHRLPIDLPRAISVGLS